MALGDQRTIRVVGLAELQRAFAVASREMSRDLKSALESAGEPVRQSAERLAVEGIPKIGVPWSRMRVGVTRTSVYVAPRQRGVRGVKNPRRRPNLAPLLMSRALEPALDANRDKVEQEIEDAITDMAKAWERV